MTSGNSISNEMITKHCVWSKHETLDYEPTELDFCCHKRGVEDVQVEYRGHGGDVGAMLIQHLWFSGTYIQLRRSNERPSHDI
jgi:hypothetical protein